MKTNIKAKSGKSFPDLNKDGKITKADILKGRGVIAKNGKPVKKAFLGALAPLAMKALPMLGGMLGGGGGEKKGGMGGIGGMLGGLLGGKNGKTVKKSKSGSTIKKAMNGYGGKAASMVPMKMGGKIKKAQTGNAIIDKASKDYKSYSAGTGPKPPLSSGFKNGGSTKKCKYGCK